ncbi:MAG: sterol carrier family protein [Candidatus Nanopelagicales bacterium]
MREEVKAALAAFAAAAPGRSVEIRVPPYAAIQAVPGGPHRRGTPRAVVECDGPTWLALVRGELTWARCRRNRTGRGQRRAQRPVRVVASAVSNVPGRRNTCPCGTSLVGAALPEPHRVPH